MELLSNVKSDQKWKAAIVIQGPHYGKSTISVIYEFLEKNKDVLLIISTYSTELSTWEKELINEGRVVYIFVEQPPTSDEEFWKSNFANQNLQRLTSYHGLKFAESIGIKYSLKIRSDTFLGIQNSIDYFIYLHNEFPISEDVKTKMMGRIIVCSHATISNPVIRDRYSPFHIRDHWYFGFTGDLIKFFDINSITWNGGSGISRCSPESSMTVVWMKDLGIECKDITELLGRYFIVEDFELVEQCRLHDSKADQSWVIDMEEYKKGGSIYIRDFIHKLDSPDLFTSHDDWLKFLD